MGKDNIDQIVGASFENLDTEDMEQVQGAGDVEAETTIASPSVVINPTAVITITIKR